MSDEKTWSEAQEVENILNDKAKLFDELCRKRHEDGQQEYGAVSFLGNDVLRMMLEELADTTNYCRMQAIKLLLLQEQLEEQLSTGEGFKHGDDLQIGWQSFRGTKKGWGE